MESFSDWTWIWFLKQTKNNIYNFQKNQNLKEETRAIIRNSIWRKWKKIGFNKKTTEIHDTYQYVILFYILFAPFNTYLAVVTNGLAIKTATTYAYNRSIERCR